MQIEGVCIRLHACACVRQLQLQRQQKCICVRFMESKGEADWIMGKKRRNVQEGGREKIRDRERERERERGREILWSNIKVRLMLPKEELTLEAECLHKCALSLFLPHLPPSIFTLPLM